MGTITVEQTATPPQLSRQHGGFESDIMKRRLAPSTSPNHIQSNDLIQAASENATDCSNFKAIEFECILDVRRNVVNISIAFDFFANQEDL